MILGIRPEELEDAEVVPDAPADRRLKGEVELREALGSEIQAHVSISGREAVTEDVRELAGDIGTEPGGGARLATGSEEAVVVARFDPRSRAREGSPGRDGGRHAGAALLRSGDELRNLRRRLRAAERRGTDEKQIQLRTCSR